ncbi:MAG: ATP-grasp domain-containing protein [Clostridia bacterium]|nr:ATP-grasp domain-containing protein [Clostridia bacterium]
MKRLLIIGASVLQVPAIRKAKELGLYVAVADYNPNAVGIPLADEYYNVSTIDEEGVYRAAKEFKADGIMTLATDMPMRSLAYACEKLGLVGLAYDSAVKATDKGEMIKTFETAKVEHPWYQIIPGGTKPTPGTFTFPLITKPTDNSGSRGVMLVHNEDELAEALSYSSENGRRGDVIMEEYMQGPEVSVEVMVSHGAPHVLQITDKLTTGAPHFVEMGHSQPSRLPEEAQDAIRDLASRAALSVGIQNGPAHVEIILTKNGPKMVELGARMGGDCITTHLVPLSTGIDMVGNTIKIALGEDPDLEQKLWNGSAIRYFNAPHGVIREISGVEEAEMLYGVQEITFVKQVGDTVGDIGSSTDRVGFVIAQADNAEEAVKVCERVLQMVKIIVE